MLQNGHDRTLQSRSTEDAEIEGNELELSDGEVVGLRSSTYSRLRTNSMDSHQTVVEDHWSKVFSDLWDEMLVDYIEQNNVDDTITGSQQEISLEEANERVETHRNGGLSGWDYQSSFTAHSISVDNVNADLAGRFLVEANGILDKSEREYTAMDGEEEGSQNYISRLQAFNVFLPASVL